MGSGDLGLGSVSSPEHYIVLTGLRVQCGDTSCSPCQALALSWGQDKGSVGNMLPSCSHGWVLHLILTARQGEAGCLKVVPLCHEQSVYNKNII